MGFAEDNGIDIYDGNITDNYIELGEYYHNNYNLATIGNAKWVTANKEEIQFKDMKENHILNCIKRFNNYHLLIGAFKLELLRRKLQSIIDCNENNLKRIDSFDKMSYEDYTGK